MKAFDLDRLLDNVERKINFKDLVLTNDALVADSIYETVDEFIKSDYQRYVLSFSTLMNSAGLERAFKILSQHFNEQLIIGRQIEYDQILIILQKVTREQD